MLPRMFKTKEVSNINQSIGVIASPVNDVIPAWKRQISFLFYFFFCGNKNVSKGTKAFKMA